MEFLTIVFKVYFADFSTFFCFFVSKDYQVFWRIFSTVHILWFGYLHTMILSLYLCAECIFRLQIDGLVQERRNSIANAPELRLSCTNPSK